MKGKILFATGLAVGYVLGSKAGRKRYEQIKSAADKFWSNPTVHERVVQVEDFVKEKAPDVAGFVTENAKKVASQVSGLKEKQGKKEPTTPAPGAASTEGPPASTSGTTPPSPDMSTPPSTTTPG